MDGLTQAIDDLKCRTGSALAMTLDRIAWPNCGEQALASAWLEALREDDFYPDGWYDPPPHGVIALFGDRQDGYSRICQPSFRPQEMWPGDRSGNSETITAAYASPVQRGTNLIGDFGCCLYNGQDRDIRDHFRRVLASTLQIASLAESGMRFCDLYQLGMEEGRRQGFSNNIESSTDATGTNIGHTIPFSYRSDPANDAIAKAGSFAATRDIIRDGRRFLNGAETQVIEPDMAFTIEPRFSTATMPNTWFHLTVVFEKGRRTICHGLRPVLERAGMEYLTDLLP